MKTRMNFNTTLDKKLNLESCDNCKTKAPADFVQSGSSETVCHVCLQNAMFSANINPLLKNFRNTYDLTQKEAAELLGYGYYSWSSYESGRREIPKHLIKSIEYFKGWYNLQHL